MDGSFPFGDLIGYGFLALIIYLLLRLHFRTKFSINEWAKDNQFEIIWIKYTPWYWFIRLLSGGIHPANFRVLVQNQEGEHTEFQITGGGFFLISDSIKVKEILKNH